jgi:hypothetical protein
VAVSVTNDSGAPLPVTVPDYGTKSTFNLPVIPAGGSVFLQTDGTNALVSGAATITSDVPIGAAVIFSVFDTKGNFTTEAGLGASPVENTVTVPAANCSNTGVALFNTGTSTAWVSVILLDEDGCDLRASILLSIPARGHYAGFVSGIFKGLSDFKGSVIFAATQPLAAVTLRQNPSPLSYTTLPIAAGRSTGKSRALLAAQIAGIEAGAGQTANLILPSGFELSGKANFAGSVYSVQAVANDGTSYQGEVSIGAYSVLLPAGRYYLKLLVSPATSNYEFVYTDPTPLTISGPVTHDVTIPSLAQ